MQTRMPGSLHVDAAVKAKLHEQKSRRVERVIQVPPIDHAKTTGGQRIAQHAGCETTPVAEVRVVVGP